MAKVHRAAIIDFIIKEIEKGSKPKDILAKCGKKWREISGRTFSRYQKEAETEVLKRKEQRDKEDAETDRMLRDAEIASNYCDIDERKQFLAKVVRGEDLRPADQPPDIIDVVLNAMSDKEETKGKGKAPKPKKARPIIAGIDARLAAVDLLNKMDHLYVKRTKNEDAPAPLIITLGPRPPELDKKKKE